MHPLEEQSSSCCGNLSAQTASQAAFLLRTALSSHTVGAEAVLRAAARPWSSAVRRPRTTLGPPRGRHSAAGSAGLTAAHLQQAGGAGRGHGRAVDDHLLPAAVHVAELLQHGDAAGRAHRHPVVLRPGQRLQPADPVLQPHRRLSPHRRQSEPGAGSRRGRRLLHQRIEPQRRRLLLPRRRHRRAVPALRRRHLIAASQPPRPHRACAVAAAEGPAPRGRAVPALPERGRFGTMEESGPLFLNVGSVPMRPNALKRKLQSSPHGNPPLKRKPKPSVNNFKKRAAETGTREKGSSSKRSLPKKQVTANHNESQKSKLFIKTSSLFRNNPDIPEIHRKAVQQVQESVFTTDSFSQLDLHPHLIATITTVLKICNMTSVQKQTIPVLLQGKDALVRSQTGSGKTLAYGIPLVQSLQGMKSKIQRSDGPYALVLVPTRELALQTFDTMQKLLKPFTWIVPGVLMGGEKRKSEKARLRKGINILISTPGRLVDHIKSTKCIHFRRTQWLIIDEADRILDLGFEKDVTVILNALNAERETRQNVLLSATLTEGVTRLADISLNDPIRISIADEIRKSLKPTLQTEKEANSTSNCMDQENFAVPEKLKQYFVMVPSKLRLVTLAAFILEKCKYEKQHKMIVFFSSCEQVEFHYELLVNVLSGELESEQPKRSSVSSVQLQFLRLHGNMGQEERTEVFQEFLKSDTGILLCTDVAARGLDLPQVTWIVQYNAPASPAEYIHRIGRTARIGCHGNSLLVLVPSEAEYVSLLASHKINVSEIKMEKVLSSLMKDDRFRLHRPGSKKSYGVDPQEVRERATVLQTRFENYVHSGERTIQWAKKALQSFLCAYAAYPRSLKHIFHIKSIHLGHVAKSFGLRDAPQNLTTLPTANSKKKSKLRAKRSDLLKKIHGKHRLAEILRSEYSSGMDTGVSKVKKKKKKQRKTGNQQIPV